MTAPLVFVSYSHDSPEHRAWVLHLATDLRTNGVDAMLDQWDLAPGQDLVAFMQRGINNSDRVILVCSEDYVRRAEAGLGGVGYERLVVTAELVENIDTKKFIPLVRNNASSNRVPRFLGPRLYIDFSNDADYPAKLEELLREILGAPSNTKPPLGRNPFSGSPPPATAGRTAGPTGRTATGQPVLDDEWFVEQATAARDGIARVGLHACMEVRVALHQGVARSQIELLTAMRQSEIRTFGWPIGVAMENRDEFRPRPYADGIKAEIAINASAMTGRTSYDYWTLRSNGDFYLLQSLFEDQRAENKIFFNTRIVRVTESLLFISNLYKNLGVAPETHLSVRVTHRGFAGRELTSASFNRDILPAVSREDASQVEIVTILGTMRETLVEDVRRITAPLFMLFDFTEFSDDVYRDIVRRFERGEVS